MRLLFSIWYFAWSSAFKGPFAENLLGAPPATQRFIWRGGPNTSWKGFSPPRPSQHKSRHNTDPRCAKLRTHFATWSSAAPWHMTCGSAGANSNPFAQHSKLKFFIQRVDSGKWMRAVFSINDKCYTWSYKARRIVLLPTQGALPARLTLATDRRPAWGDRCNFWLKVFALSPTICVRILLARFVFSIHPLDEKLEFTVSHEST